ncbi:MAG: UDP-N-acetylglucosamine 2-epimerase (non-hydrolyzing) [Anaerolineales bacterium]|nr:UDP-N-acetylglucosamine 2-epimerase (non-hydrolyzing) [Anaerolineales bacterium]
MKIINVVGARPNLMKIAPLVAEMKKYSDINQILLHTGQHYDEKMSQVFFDQLGIPRPDIYLGVGSGSHAEQTARVLLAFEQVLIDNTPDVILVVGDVNSTLACSITAAKLGIPVAHVEAGLRSFDRSMPEEINRILTDMLSEYLFTTSRDANENLIKEGISTEKIFFVGNVMIDTLNKHRAQAKKLNTPKNLGVSPGEYALLTLHRPSNVDEPAIFSEIIDALVVIQNELPILFPAHPRTLKRIKEFGFIERLSDAANLQIIEPLGYLEFLDLMMHARLVLTDSGGIQEETTILNVPCLTIRENTERPITITEGTNFLAGTDKQSIIENARKIIAGKGRTGKIPELWDGNAAKRIVQVLLEQTQTRKSTTKINLI